MTNPEAQLTGRVDFPEAGDGVFLLLKTPAFLELQKRFGEDWQNKVLQGFDKFDMDVLSAVAQVGGKKDGKPQIINIVGIETMTLVDLRDKLRDAYFYGFSGRSFMDQLEYAMKLQQEAMARGQEDEPDESPPNPEASSAR